MALRSLPILLLALKLAYFQCSASNPNQFSGQQNRPQHGQFAASNQQQQQQQQQQHVQPSPVYMPLQDAPGAEYQLWELIVDLLKMGHFGNTVQRIEHAEIKTFRIVDTNRLASAWTIAVGKTKTANDVARELTELQHTRAMLKWEEVDSLYSFNINNQNVFAMIGAYDLSTQFTNKVIKSLYKKGVGTKPAIHETPLWKIIIAILTNGIEFDSIVHSFTGQRVKQFQIRNTNLFAEAWTRICGVRESRSDRLFDDAFKLMVQDNILTQESTASEWFSCDTSEWFSWDTSEWFSWDARYTFNTENNAVKTFIAGQAHTLLNGQTLDSLRIMIGYYHQSKLPMKTCGKSTP